MVVKAILNEDINIRRITEHYFNCPHCDEEINDLEYGFSDNMNCPHCSKGILLVS